MTTIDSVRIALQSMRSKPAPLDSGDQRIAPVAHTLSMTEDGLVVTFELSRYRHRLGVRVSDLDVLTDHADPQQWAEMAVIAVDEFIDTGRSVWASRERLADGTILLGDQMVEWPDHLNQTIGRDRCTLVNANGESILEMLTVEDAAVPGTPVIRPMETKYQTNLAFAYLRAVLMLAHQAAYRGHEFVAVDATMPGVDSLGTVDLPSGSPKLRALRDDFLAVKWSSPLFEYAEPRGKGGRRQWLRGRIVSIQEGPN